MFARLACTFALSALVAAGASAQERDLVFAITEGVTYQATPKDIRDKFTPLADAVAKATGRRVKLLVVPSYDDVRAGLGRQEYDLAFVHPAHVALAEVKSGRYRAIAWTVGFTDYSASLLMNPNQPLKSLADLKGRTVVTPDPDSITAAMIRAMFREAKLPLSTGHDVEAGSVRVITTRYQDAVPFYLENGFAQVGATAARSVVKSWTDKGGVVLARSRAVPIKQLIVAARVPAGMQARIAQALLDLRDSRPGREALDVVGYKGFVAPNAEVEGASIAWLGL
jgi:phosphonate transport system substrate-binding protein